MVRDLKGLFRPAEMRGDDMGEKMKMFRIRKKNFIYKGGYTRSSLSLF